MPPTARSLPANLLALIIDVATGTGAAAFSAVRQLRPSRAVALDISPRIFLLMLR